MSHEVEVRRDPRAMPSSSSSTLALTLVLLLSGCPTHGSHVFVSWRFNVSFCTSPKAASSAMGPLVKQLDSTHSGVGGGDPPLDSMVRTEFHTQSMNGALSKAEHERFYSSFARYKPHHHTPHGTCHTIPHTTHHPSHTTHHTPPTTHHITATPPAAAHGRTCTLSVIRWSGSCLVTSTSARHLSRQPPMRWKADAPATCT